MEETHTISQVLSGNPDAYRLLVERYQVGLIIHCENLVKNRQDAEDIAQEAFVKAYSNLSRFSADKARFSTWLYRIATNLTIDFLRKTHPHVDVENIETLAAVTMPTFLEDEERHYIQKVVSELEPPKYGALIRAYFWHGKSYQQLADEYETTTGTIGTWISRAKLQLKEKLS